MNQDSGENNQAVRRQGQQHFFYSLCLLPRRTELRPHAESEDDSDRYPKETAKSKRSTRRRKRLNSKNEEELKCEKEAARLHEKREEHFVMSWISSSCWVLPVHVESVESVAPEVANWRQRKSGKRASFLEEKYYSKRTIIEQFFLGKQKRSKAFTVNWQILHNFCKQRIKREICVELLLTFFFSILAAQTMASCIRNLVLKNVFTTNFGL